MKTEIDYSATLTIYAEDNIYFGTAGFGTQFQIRAYHASSEEDAKNKIRKVIKKLNKALEDE